MNELFRTALFLPPQSSTMAGAIDYLHYFVIAATLGGAVLVTFFGGLFILRYRRNRHPDENHREIEAPRAPAWLEALVIGGLFTLFIAFWLVGYRQYVELRIAPEGALTVYVTAKQWMWKFSYPEGNHSIAALVVPARRPVKLVMTSRDVVHSLFVPDFRIKQDVLPGRYTTVWFEANAPGRHAILCTQFCGTNHSTMRGEVIALDGPDWDRFIGHGAPQSEIAGQRYVPPSVVGDFAPPEQLSLVRLGEAAAAEHGCLRCHTTDGTRFIGPTFAGLYLSRVPIEGDKTVIADEAYLTESMMDPVAKIHRGFTPVMPSYLGLLPPSETAAIVELIKALRDIPATPEQGRGPLAPRPQKLPEAGAIGQPPHTLGISLPGLPEGTTLPNQHQQGTPIPSTTINPPPAGKARYPQ